MKIVLIIRFLRVSVSQDCQTQLTGVPIYSLIMLFCHFATTKSNYIDFVPITQDDVLACHLLGHTANMT